MTTCFPEARKTLLAMARVLLQNWFMQPSRVTMLLVGVLLSGCVSTGLYPRSYGGYPYGGYSPVYGGGYSPVYGGGYSPVYRSGPYYGGPYFGDRYWDGNRDWYDNRYY